MLALNGNPAKPHDPSTTLGAAWIHLLSIKRLGHGTGFVCEFRSQDGKRTWQVQVTPQVLQSFRQFQKLVAAEFGLWIRHNCEQERTARMAVAEWDLDVEQAWRAGS
jgi:hypothetical protein